MINLELKEYENYLKSLEVSKFSVLNSKISNDEKDTITTLINREIKETTWTIENLKKGL